MDTSSLCVSSKTERFARRSTSTIDCIRDAVADLYRIDDFDLEHLGSGFFSDVFKVRHRSTGQVLVLKRSKSTNTRSQILQEVELMKRLSHPNILNFCGVCVHEGQLHPLLEFINGGNLEELLLNKDENLAWSFRFQLARDIASGMNYLHSRGVIHRDLTAKNCLIKRHDDKSASAIVADFGLAAKMPRISLARDGRHVFSVVGTPFSMAPEVLKGERYNEKADVFSYGIILCQIIARISSDPDYMPRTKTFGVDGEILRSMVPECPSLAWNLAMECCELDPQERPDFQCIKQMLDANYRMPYTETPPLPSELNSFHRSDSSDDDFETTSSPSTLGLHRSRSFTNRRASSAERSFAAKKSLTYSPAIPLRSISTSSCEKTRFGPSTGSSSSGIHSGTSDNEFCDVIDPVQEPPEQKNLEVGVVGDPGCEGSVSRGLKWKRRRSSARYATTPVCLSAEEFEGLFMPLPNLAVSAPSSPNASRRHLLNTKEFRAALATSPIAGEMKLKFGPSLSQAKDMSS